ncbi:hypothetical protein EV138_2799 [Kribbella voronezhensis]|uniref:Uncharacterized protein n=1 Tax=Kribbella voronezhensis TaxID=2512212 RepID=A0A4R7TD11_9ACTN|nr:hypothetical protein [Kribbella voronezhensis]TDU89238.1 hypothetical protein EV138_2799 [Kribbella voronezhensis]
MNEEINRRLREAAEAHEPNRPRILARVERGMADPVVRHRTPSIARSWPRAAIVGLVAAATLATGGLAVAAIGGVPSLPAAAPPAVASTSPVPSPTVTSTSTPSARATSTGRAPATTAPSSRSTPSGGSRLQDGPLRSQGSIDVHSNLYWAQNDLILKTTEQLTSLTVELRIAQTGGVQKTGNWQTLSSDDFTVTVQESGGALLYRWTLKPGHTVPAGEHEFAAQYNHAPGIRKIKRDTYHVHAQTPRASSEVWGGFTPPR